MPSPTYYTLELGPVRLVVMNAEDEGDAQFKYMLQLLQDVSHARQTHVACAPLLTRSVVAGETPAWQAALARCCREIPSFCAVRVCLPLCGVQCVMRCACLSSMWPKQKWTSATLAASAEVRHRYVPLFEQYGVDLVVSAHPSWYARLLLHDSPGADMLPCLAACFSQLPAR